MKKSKLLNLSKCENKSKCEELLKNNSNFNNNSTKNIEIRKETQELRPNSEIKTELATTMPTHNFIENSLVILTKQTLDIFLRQENPSELIALYTFYYYTAKWQQTNQIKCTSSYVAKGLHWRRNKVIKVRKQLLEMGLIEDIRRVDAKTRKIVGYYVKMNYVFKQSTLEKYAQKESQCTPNAHTGNDAHSALETQYLQQKNQCIPIDTLDFSYTNALSTNNKNALSTDNNIYIRAKDCASMQIEPDIESKNNKCANKCANKNNAQSLIENKNTEPLSATKNKSLRKSKPKLAPKVLEEEFDAVWDLYPKKKDKTRAFKAFSKARKEGVPLEKIREGVQKYVQEIENTGIAHQYIKYGSTWFNNRCWEDEYDTNTKSSYNLNAYEKSMDTFEGEPEEPPDQLGIWL